jgi:hypothetical protein
MTTSRTVMPRGRVNMNVTTFAPSLASSRLPDSLASFSFSGGQSASSALMTGPGEIAERHQRCLVAVDHHHARACSQHCLGTGQSDARRSPSHAATLPSNSLARGLHLAEVTTTRAAV